MKTVTFYSYKGGVGRSLALANMATRLADFNKKVCVLDFDLEAPGLPLKFANTRDIALNNGIVDYIHSYAVKGVLPQSIQPFSFKFNIANKEVQMIPAGNDDSMQYWKNLSAINWHSLLYENENGIAFFLDLQEKIKKELKPDFLLIDSRTGISEMSGITISLMADEVVVVCANNRENINGVKKIIKGITNPENKIEGNNLPRVSLVMSRLPFTNKPEDKSKEKILIEKLKREFDQVYNDDFLVIHSDRELEENESIKIATKFDEGVSSTSKDYLLLFERLFKNDLSEDELKRFDTVKEAESIFKKAKNTDDEIEKIALINRAIELDNKVEYYLFRSEVHEKQSNYELALKDVEYVLGINQGNWVASIYKLDLLYKLKKYSEGELFVEWCLNKYSTIDFLLFRKALFISYRNLDEAEIIYLSLLEKNEYDNGVLNNLANIYFHKGSFEKALEYIYKSLRIEPNEVCSLLTLAEIKFAMENIEEFYLGLDNALSKDKVIVKDCLEGEMFTFYEKLSNEERLLDLLDKYDLQIQGINI